MLKNPTKNKDTYFANLEGQDFIDNIRAKIEEFHDDLSTSGLRDVIERSYRAYYGGNLSDMGSLFESAKLSRGGRNGEITNLKVNHYRNLLRHALQLATATKPAVACRASNSDTRSQTQAVLGTGLIDFYMREKKVDRLLHQAVEQGLVALEGWVHMPWNPSKGEKYITDAEGNSRYQGDIEFSVHGLLDVARDINKTHDDNHEWLCVKNKQNRYNLIAKYPQLKDELLQISAEDEVDEDFNIFNNTRSKSDELINVYTFYHEQTEAVDGGRLVIFTGDIILFDGKIPYNKIPLFRVTPDRLLNTPYGYSPAIEILAPQQMVDILTSTIASNQAATGVQSIWSQRGDTINVNHLANGLKHFQSDTRPEPISLTQTAPEIFNFRRDLIGEQETLMGISSTVRGNPEANLKSGSALALVVAQSIQFASELERSANGLLEDVGTCIIDHLRQFSTTPRVAALVGNFNRPFITEFTADDLEQINRVVVEQTSPLSKTISGRVEIANQLLQQGFIDNPNQYITVLTTGNLDPAIQGKQSKLLNISAENEALQRGEQVEVVVTENHAEHIQEHHTIIENPEAKKNPILVQNVLNHIQLHLDAWRTADPAILAITKQMPPPPPNQPAPMPPEAPQSNGQAPQVIENEPVLPGDMPNQPNMPNLPPDADPMTQQAYEKMPK